MPRTTKTLMTPATQARLKSQQDADFAFMLGRTTVRPEATIMRDILDCYCGLSPENLWCDGEATATQAKRTASRLNARLKTLFKELGRKVTEEEAYATIRR